MHVSKIISLKFIITIKIVYGYTTLDDAIVVVEEHLYMPSPVVKQGKLFHLIIIIMDLPSKITRQACL